MAKNVKPVNMNSDTFKDLKGDMTETMNKLIRNMIEFHSDKAAMTVKVTIQMDSTAGVVFPKFKHKVSCTVQQKDEKNGEMFGVYTLEKNEDGTFFLKQEQTDLFESAEA